MTRISAEAYQALREVLATVTWYKRDLKSLMRALVRDEPQLLASLNFDDTKRVVADQFIEELMAKEARYQALTLTLIAELAGRSSFPDLERLEEPDRSVRLQEATAAVSRLASIANHQTASARKASGHRPSGLPT